MVGQTAGRFIYHLTAWEKLSQDPFIFECVRGHRIQFLQEPHQILPKITPVLDVVQEKTISEEVQKMLQKNAIEKAKYHHKEFVSSLFWYQKDGGYEAGHQPQTTERVYSQGKVQDGNPLYSVEDHEKGRLSSVTRSKGRVFLHSNCGKSPQISQIYLEEPKVPISLSAFRANLSATDFRESSETSSGQLEETRHQDRHLFGRHLDYSVVKKRVHSTSQHHYRFIDFARFYYQRGKIMFGAVTRNSVSRFYSGLSIHDSENRSKQVQRHNREVQRSSGQRQVIDSPGVKYHRAVEVSLASSVADQFVLQTSSGGPDTGFGQRQRLQRDDDPLGATAGGVVDLDTLYQHLERSPHTPFPSGLCHADRCISARLGGGGCI